MESQRKNSDDTDRPETAEVPLTKRDVERLLNLGNQDQYEGNYGKATEKYLQSLEILCQLGNYKSRGSKENWTSLRALVIEKLGNNLNYLGQHEIALKYYEQQLRTIKSISSKLGIASAYHNIGLCYFFLHSFRSAIELQEQSQEFLEDVEEDFERKELECSIKLFIGLNKHYLGEYEAANGYYQKSLAIAKHYGLPIKEAEAIIRFNALSREKIGLESSDFDKREMESIMGDLHYAIRIIDKNPYLKILGLRGLAKIHEVTDLDIAQKYYEEALEISVSYKLEFSDSLKNDVQRILEKKKELADQEYVLEEQEWYCEKFPKIPEIEREAIESSGFKADFAIVTATSIELKAVVHLLEEDPTNSSLPCRFYTQYGQYYLGKFGKYSVVVIQCRVGTRDERSAGFATQKVLEIWNPKAVIMVGIAFGKNSREQKIADVLVATEIIDYEVTRIGLDGIVDRGTRPPSNRNLLSLFEQAYEWQFYRPDSSLCQLIAGPILSGEKLIDNLEFKTELFRRFPHAKGGEMEGIGFCSAANSLNKPWILIKSICDWADGSKKDKHQPLAAAASVSLVHYVLSQRTLMETFK